MIKLKNLLNEIGREMFFYGDGGNSNKIKSSLERTFKGRWKWEDKNIKVNLSTDIPTAGSGLKRFEYILGQLDTDLTVDEFEKKAKSISGFRIKDKSKLSLTRGRGNRIKLILTSNDDILELTYLPASKFPSHPTTIMAEFRK